MQLEYEDRMKLIEYNKQIEERLIDICLPLKIINIDSFTYLRFYKGGSVLRIETNLEYNKYMLNNAAVNTYQFIIDRIANGEKVTLPFSPTDIVTSALEHCGIKAILSSFYSKDDYIEGWGIFSSRNDLDLTPSFISNIQLIERFIVYFNNVAKDLIQRAEKDKILFHSTLMTTDFDIVCQQEKVKNFLKSTEPETWQMKVSNLLYVKLTRTEVICLTYLLYGHSYKVIAGILNVSHKTIEKHMENIRAKTGLHCKQRLLQVFAQSDLHILSPVFNLFKF